MLHAGLSTTAGINSGTGGILSVRGDNVQGVITVNTGINPDGQNIGRIGFSQSYGSDNVVVTVVPANRQAVGLAVMAEGIEGSGFELNCSQQLDGNNVYQWYYSVIEIIEVQ